MTPLIGKLRLHVQGYVDQEEFYVSPLSSVSHASLQKSIKKLFLFAYMIFVNEPLSSKESYAKIDQEDQMKLLKEFKDCFSIAK